MFELFQRNANAAVTLDVDANLLRERLAEALRDAGFDPQGKRFATLFKLISDDIDWYLEQAGEEPD